MKQFSLTFSPLALKDLEAIGNYVFEQSQEKKTARDAVRNIFTETQRLKDFPELGIKLDEYLNIKTDYRMFVAGKYNTFYRIDVSAIRVVRIFAGQQDWMAALFGEDTPRP